MKGASSSFCSSTAQSKNSNSSTHRAVSNANNVKSVTLNPRELGENSYIGGIIIKKESLSCDSISKTSSSLSANTTSIVEPIAIVCKQYEAIVADLDDAINSENETAQNMSRSPLLDKTTNNGSLLSVNSCGMFGSSGSSCGHNISTASTATVCNGPMISLSKSETNICESDRSNGGSNKLTIYNVVSLNDLNQTDPFFDRPMNDLSKNQCLTKISDVDLCDLSQKKHITAITNPKMLNSITVSMRNAADVSDKIF